MAKLHNNEMPLVSVIMPVYNCGRYLEEAILSIMHQTYKNIEILILNDGSNDGSEDIIDKYFKIDKRIKYFKKSHIGLKDSLNYLVSMAKGKFIARMDGDDISHPERIRKQVEYMLDNKKCGVVGCGFVTVDEKGGFINGYIPPDDHIFLLKMLEKKKNIFKHGSLFFRSDILKKIEGPYRFEYGQDYDLLLRISEIAKLGIVRHILYKHRMRGNSMQEHAFKFRKEMDELILNLHYKRIRLRQEGEWRKEEEEILNKKTKAKKSDICYSLYANARAAFQEKNFKEAKKLFLLCIKKRKYLLSSTAYILLTFFPKSLAKKIYFYLSKKRDKLGKYRINEEIWLKTKNELEIIKY